MTVLVLAQQADTPVDAVIRELDARDVPVCRIDTAWFPRELVLDASLGGDGRWTGELRNAHRTVNLEGIRSIWYRGPGAFGFAETMTDVERAYAHREARLGLGGVLASLDVRWVNHPNRSADAVYKPLQLATAARCGLTTVPTVITNSADAVRRLPPTAQTVSCASHSDRAPSPKAGSSPWPSPTGSAPPTWPT